MDFNCVSTYQFTVSSYKMDLPSVWCENKKELILRKKQIVATIYTKLE